MPPHADCPKTYAPRRYVLCSAEKASLHPETKGVLSLLFPSTWITHTVIISAFFVVAMAVNVSVIFRFLLGCM
jgi:hypothetical protein